VVAFVVVERRTRDPLVPPRLWSVRPFLLGAGVVGGIVNAGARIGTAVGIAVLLVVASGSGRPLAAYLLAAALATAALVVTVSHRRDRRRSP
jgi:hypothetical protein